MIDVREAVTIAQKYLQELFPDEATDIRLEEVELVKGGSGDEWQVTLSFLRPGDTGQTLGQLLSPDARRQYKTFTIDAGDRQVRSMKIRRV